MENLLSTKFSVEKTRDYWKKIDLIVGFSSVIHWRMHVSELGVPQMFRNQNFLIDFSEILKI